MNENKDMQLSSGSAEPLPKRPFAFAVRRAPENGPDEWRLFRDEGAAREAAMQLDGDYEALYRVGDRRSALAQARVDELEHRVLAHEKLQARIVQALGRETWQGDLAAAVEADVARANANAESCKQFSDRLRDIVTALDHGLSQRAREAAELALRMPWLSGSSVPSTQEGLRGNENNHNDAA